MINIWGIAIQKEYQKWIDFRESLAKDLIHFN